MIYIFHKMSHIAIKFRKEFKVRTTLQTNSHRHITSHRRTNPIDLGEYRMNSFLQKHKKEILYITAYGVKL